jgi:hypothetical protein
MSVQRNNEGRIARVSGKTFLPLLKKLNRRPFDFRLMSDFHYSPPVILNTHAKLRTIPNVTARV